MPAPGSALVSGQSQVQQQIQQMQQRMQMQQHMQQQQQMQQMQQHMQPMGGGTWGPTVNLPPVYGAVDVSLTPCFSLLPYLQTRKVRMPV